jgi:hypothetical protein
MCQGFGPGTSSAFYACAGPTLLLTVRARNAGPQDIGHDPKNPNTRLYATSVAQPYHNDAEDLVGELLGCGDCMVSVHSMCVSKLYGRHCAVAGGFSLGVGERGCTVASAGHFCKPTSACTADSWRDWRLWYNAT